MRKTAPGPDQQSVFLNVPFDHRYAPLFIALIAGLTALGRKPRCVLEVASSGPTRLNRIVGLIAECGASILDCFAKPKGNPPLTALKKLTRRLSRAVGSLQREHGVDSPFFPHVFRQATEAALELAKLEKLID